MQTFLPYPDFKKSAQSLDYRRLGKQRVETKQIYFSLTRQNYGWKNHPIVKMWKGYEAALLQYGVAICEEWIKRGYKDNQLQFFKSELDKYTDIKYPNWLGNDRLHLSHQSRLIQKDNSYKTKFTDAPDNLNYWWAI